MIRRILTTLICAAMLLAVSAPALAGEELFSDVPPTHWAAEVVARAAELGLMEGMGGGLFGIERQMTRAEFITVLCRLFGWTGEDMPAPTFDDMAESHWAFRYAEAASAQGVRDDESSFRPDDRITRLEMAVFLVQGLGYDALAGGISGLSSPFPDVEGNGYVNIAYDIGMIQGDENGCFHPGGFARREEAAAMLVRVYERLDNKVTFVNGFFYADSFPQLDIAAEMDKVSFGWARMMQDEEGSPYLNLTSANGNHWYKPEAGEDALAALKEAGVPYDLTVFSGAPTALKICADPELRAGAIEALVAAAEGYTGLCIDFEGMQSGKDAFSQFMRELRGALPEEQPLSVCVPPLQYYADGFDFRALGEVCDRVILMAHDYQWSEVPRYYVGTARTNIVNAPSDKIYRALREITAPETGVADRSKIVLAINFAAYGLKVDEEGLLLSTARANPYLNVLRARLRQEDTAIHWSELHQSPYAYYYTEDGSRYIMWYEDARSVQAKIRLARMFDIHAISFWRLGAIPNDPADGIYYNVWETVQGERAR